MKDSIVKNKSYAFAVNIVRLAGELRQQREYELSKQVMRSGTSMGANIEEALAGISRRDFTAKMSIASKEARETPLLAAPHPGFRIYRVEIPSSPCLETLKNFFAS